MSVQFTIEQNPDGTLEVTAYTDAPYAPDIADDMVNRAVALWRGACDSIAMQEPEA